MGCTESIQLPDHFTQFQNWPAPKVSAMIKSYIDGEYDYGIDHTVVMALSGLNLDESKVLVKALSKGDSIIINATVFLLTVIMLSEPNRRIEAGQLGMIFDVFDFNMNGSISFDEFCIMLLCIATAQGAIICEQDFVPNDAAIVTVAEVMYEELGKNKTHAILKEDVLNLWKNSFTSHGVITIDKTFERFRLGKKVIFWEPEED
jgi:hypothetical protein